MRKTNSLISLVLLFLPLSFFAQFFGLLQKVPQQYYWAALNYPQDDKYRALNCIQWSANETFYYRRSQVLVFNSSYQLVDSVNLLNGFLPSQSPPLKQGARLYWAGHYYDTLAPSINTSQLAVLELDTNYKYLSLHKISNMRTFAGNAPIGTNMFYMRGRFYINHNFKSDTSVIYKLSSQFLKVDSVIITGVLPTIQGFDNQLMLNGTNLASPCFDMSNGNVEKLVLDTAYNIISCFTFSSVGVENYAPWPQPISIRQYFGAQLLPLSNTKILAVGVMGVVHTPPPSLIAKLGIVNCVISETDALVKSTVYSNSLTNCIYITPYDNVAVKGNEIISVGCYGIDDQLLYTRQAQNNSVLVNKFDTLGNLVWQQKYGNDFFYAPTGIAFTSDGGCLVSGWRYPGVTSPQQVALVESFLLKLDANGTYGQVASLENENFNYNPVKCFPVPTTELIYFDVLNQTEMSVDIYNTLGQLVKQQNNYRNLEAIDVASLNKDVYFYKIMSKTDIYFGKFMKE